MDSLFRLCLVQAGETMTSGGIGTGPHVGADVAETAVTSNEVRICSGLKGSSGLGLQMFVARCPDYV